MKLFDWNNSIERDMNTIYRSLEELEKKVNGLYKLDYHNTERPKVDILSDDFNDKECSLWNTMNELQRRIDILEEKK